MARPKTLRVAAHPGLQPAEPLWRRAPGRDAEGRALADMMLILPSLRGASRAHVERTVDLLNAVLVDFGNRVVFADLNLQLNVLWISHRPVPGLCLEMFAAVRAALPDARLVANRALVDRGG